MKMLPGSDRAPAAHLLHDLRGRRVVSAFRGNVAGKNGRLRLVRGAGAVFAFCAVLALLAPASLSADCSTNPVHIQPPFGTTLPPASVGHSYSTMISATGGTAPYTFVAPLPTALPPGLALNATSGAIAGTATKAGTYTFEIDVRDKNGCEDSAIYQINVSNTACDKTITLSPAGGALPDGTVGQLDYDEEIKASGGTAPYTYTLTGGKLPPDLDVDGEFIVGPLTTPGTYTFQITVTDAQGCKATGTYSITVKQLAGCNVVLSEDEGKNARLNSSTWVLGVAINTGSAPCAGTFEFDAAVNAPNAVLGALALPGSAFPVTCGGAGLARKCAGTGTLPPGTAVGAEVFFTANQSPILAPWTVKWNADSTSGLATIPVGPRAGVKGINENAPRKVQWAGDGR